LKRLLPLLILLITGVSLQAQVNLNQGLIAYFPFNGNANDASGGNNNGIIQNGVQLTTDRNGNLNSAYSFDGIDDYIRVPNATAFNQVNAFSIAFYFFPTQNTLQTMVGKISWSGGIGTQYQVGLGYSAQPGAFFGVNSPATGCSNQIATNNNYVKTGAGTPALNQWHCLVVSFDAGLQKIYLDGVLIETSTASFSTMNICSNSDMQIGSWWSGDPQFFQGKIDDLRFYNRELNQSEVNALCLTSCGTPPVFDFGYNQDICSPKTLQFNTPVTSAQSYQWSFGEGQVNTTSLTPSVTYTNYGTFNISLGIEYSPNCYTSITKSIPVNNSFDNSIILTPNSSICKGDSIKLNTTTDFLNYCWQSSTGAPNQVSSNGYAKPLATTTYYLNTQSTGTNLVVNGDFSAGNAGFTSDYVNAQPNTTEGQYRVTNNPPSWNPGLTNCPDHTGGGGNMMAVNGSPIVNARIWSQTVAVTPNTNYAFSTWVQSLFAVNPANLKFSINNIIIGNNIQAGAVCNWIRFGTTWNSGPATSAVITIVNNNTVAAGNDFAIDDIFFGPILIKNDSVTISVNQLPVVQSIPDATICSGQTVTLFTTGANNYTWTPATGLSATNVSSPAASPSVTTTYYVTGMDLNDCKAKDTVVVTVNNCPLAVPGFTAPDTVCVNTPVNITNTSTGASSYYWNFCVASLNTAPIATNISNPGLLSSPVFIDYAFYNGNWYGFLVNYNPGKLVRLNFGNSLLNTPTSTDLGNFGGIIPSGAGAEGIQIVFNENKWYAIIVGGSIAAGNSPRILKVDFGANLANNSPLATNWGNLGNMLQPIDLHVFKEGNNTITRFNFTNSFDNTPTGVNLGNIGGLQYPTGIFAINDNGFWRVFVVNGGDNSRTSPNCSLTRLDFGSSLLNTPTGVNLGNPGGRLQHPRDLTIMKLCNEIIGFAVNGNPNYNDLVKLNFNNNLSAAPTITSLGSGGGLNFPHSISKLFRVENDVYALITNVANNSITRLKFTGCNSSSIPNTTAQTPPPIVYNTPGVYNINLTIDENLPTQAAMCKTVVVLGPPAVTPMADTSICPGTSAFLNAVGAGAVAYSWTPATGLSATNIANPTATPSVTTEYVVTMSNSKGCSITDTVIVNVLTVQECTIVTAGFTMPDTVCVNAPVSIQNTSTGGTTYNWNFCTADLNTTPQGTNMGNPGNSLTRPCFIDYAFENGNYYGFVISNAPSSLVRLDFGNSLLNTPTATNLGNFGNIIPPGAQGIQIVKDVNGWHAISTGGDPSVGGSPRIIKISFGPSLTNNTPVATNWGNIGGLAYPVDIFIFKEGSRWYGFTINLNDASLTRFNFGTSFSAPPTGLNLGNLGNMNMPSGLFAIKDNGTWRVFVSNFGNNTISRIDFANGVTSAPSAAVNLGNPGGNLHQPRDLSILSSCNSIVGYLVNDQTHDVVRLNFSSLTSIPVATSVGIIGGTVNPHSISKLFREGADVYAFVPNSYVNTMTRLRFPGCNSSSIPGSTAFNPPPFSYSTPGVYNINLVVDDLLATQTSVCKQLVVVPALQHNATQTFNICQGDSVKIGRRVTGASYTWNTGAVTDSVFAKTPGIYYIDIVRSGCINRDSFIVQLNPMPVITMPAGSTICEGDSILLNAQATGTNSYSWSPVTGLSDPAIATPVASPGITTKYILTVTNNQNCISKDSLTVTVNSKPSFSLGSDRAICKGDSLLLDAGYAASSYIWQDGTNSPVYMVKDSGLYHVTLTRDGCSGSDSIYIGLNPDPVINVRGDTSVCNEQSVLIQTQAAGNYTYSWFPATNLSDATLQSPVAFVNNTVKYVLTATNSFNCKAKDSITITKLPAPVVDLGRDTMLCLSQSIVLNAQNPGSSYLWNNGSDAQTLNVNAAGIYFVTVTKDGCSTTDSIEVSFKPRNFTLTPATGLLCREDSVRFTVNGGNNFVWYRNGFPLGLFDSSILISGTAPGIYSVQVTESQCGYSELLFAPVLVKPAPNVSITKSNDISCANPRARLTASGGVSYKWSPATAISNDAVANPYVNPSADTWYSVTVTGLNGCRSTDSILVKINAPYNGNFYVPNAFTPNNDGKNDCLGVKFGGVVTRLNFSVYTRWGDLVFQATDLTQCWNGKFNGADANMGVYVYYLEAISNCGRVTQKGTITLIR
jgi:gliding motility-associated-like protein